MPDTLLGDGLYDLSYSDEEHAISEQKTELVTILSALLPLTPAYLCAPNMFRDPIPMPRYYLLPVLLSFSRLH